MIAFSDIVDKEIRTVAIVGHVHPDGDCCGSVAALYRYLRNNYPELSVTPFLEHITENLTFLTGDLPVREDSGEKEHYDLVISLDTADQGRIGAGKEAFERARKESRTVCIDHHKTNPGFAEVNHIEPESSSTSEVLAGLFDMDRVDGKTAEALFTGIIHDTGVFAYDCTSPRTLRLAADLLTKGVPAAKIIERSWSEHPMLEMQIGAAILNSGTLYPEDKVFIAFCPLQLTESYGLKAANLSGVAAELCHIEEAEVVLFLYQYEDGTWKGSLRSKSDVDVSAISARFGGGGHRKAAGFSVKCDPEKAAAKVLKAVREMRQL